MLKRIQLKNETPFPKPPPTPTIVAKKTKTKTKKLNLPLLPSLSSEAFARTFNETSFVGLRIQKMHLPENFVPLRTYSFGHFSCRCIEDTSPSLLYVFHREKREKIVIRKKIKKLQKKKGKKRKTTTFYHITALFSKLSLTLSLSLWLSLILKCSAEVLDYQSRNRKFDLTYASPTF